MSIPLKGQRKIGETKEEVKKTVMTNISTSIVIDWVLELLTVFLRELVLLHLSIIPPSGSCIFVFLFSSSLYMFVFVLLLSLLFSLPCLINLS